MTSRNIGIFEIGERLIRDEPERVMHDRQKKVLRADEKAAIECLPPPGPDQGSMAYTSISFNAESWASLIGPPRTDAPEFIINTLFNKTEDGWKARGHIVTDPNGKFITPMQPGLFLP